MGTIASQITSLTIVYSTVNPDADQRKHQISASLAFVQRIHRGPVNSPHKWPVTRKMFPFDDVIMIAWFQDGPPNCLTEEQSHEILDEFASAGGNFIDTAGAYGLPEEYLGNWLCK